MPPAVAGVYVHIPFHRSQRPCDDARSLPSSALDERTFIEALLSEVQTSRKQAGTADPIRTVYLGGGEPGLLAPGSVRSILASIRETLAPSHIEEATIELTPADVTNDTLNRLTDAGITRVSLETVSFVDRELTAPDAPHSAEACARAVQRLRASDISSFSVDLAFGAPGQTHARWKKSLQRAVDLRAPHVTIQEITEADVEDAEPPDGADCLAFAMTFLTAKGYRQYELSHFARPGHASGHQRNYYEHGNYLGLGPGAQSFWWTDRSDLTTARRWSNVGDVSEYVGRLDRDESPVSQVEELDPLTLAREYILLALRTSKGLDVELLSSQYDFPLRSRHGPCLERLASQGLLESDGRFVRLTNRGRLLTDAITKRLLPSEHHYSTPLDDVHDVCIRRAETPADLDAARQLFREYVNELDFELDFQDFEEEMAALPGPYETPAGAILLAEVDDDPVGVVAVKPLDEHGVCEMKRLYVRPAYRERGIGRTLASAIVDVARDIGYDVMRLDTVASMTAARSVYRSLGFDERDAYYHNPLDDVVYMERSL